MRSCAAWFTEDQILDLGMCLAFTTGWQRFIEAFGVVPDHSGRGHLALVPFMIGLMNCVLPLQIGARDVAFPFLNSLSLWLTVVGAMLVNLSLAVGNFARTGWLAYPPLSELHFSPGVGVDYYIWALQLSGIGTTLTGVNFIATILKMRAPRHDADAHAGVHLDRPLHQHPDRRGVPGSHAFPWHC